MKANETLNLIFSQLKLVFKSVSILKNQHESLVTYDFYQDRKREALLRLCFSNFAAWPLMLALVVMYFNPWRYQFTLAQSLGLENKFMQVMYGADATFVFVTACLLFFTLLFLDLEFIYLAVIGFFISQGDMHLTVGIILMSCVFASRMLGQLRWTFKLKSQTKKVWKIFSGLNFISWFVAVVVCFQLYQYLIAAGYFSFNMFANRFEFYILAVAFFYFVELVILSGWGHFYAQIISEPSQLIIQYSASKILKKLKLSRQFKKILKMDLQKNLSSRPQYTKADLGLVPQHIVRVHLEEVSFLNKAILDLT